MGGSQTQAQVSASKGAMKSMIKAIPASMTTSGTIGYAGYMAPPGGTVGSNYHVNVFEAWTPENSDSDVPRFVYNDQNINGSSDRFLVPASYLNFQNAQIGYSFPSRVLSKINISKLRMYVTCDNIVYWSYRRGLDPRQSLSGSTSAENYSPVRTVSFGLNLTF